jgi:hypothetical protein
MTTRLSLRAALAGVAAAAVAGLAACGPVHPAGSAAGAPAGTTAPATTAAATSAPAATPPAAAGAPTSAGFQVLSMSFVSDQQGFALGSVGCGASRCGALLGTTNGGATWTPLTAPARTVPGQYGFCTSGTPCDGQIRFATPLIGYAYDQSLLMTTDGGRTWRSQGQDVSSLEAADGTVVRVADSPGCSGAPGQVQVAPVGTTTWRPLPAPLVVRQCPAVLYRQGERLVLAAYGNPAGGVVATATLARSADGGQAWTAAASDSCSSPTGPDHDGYATAVALGQPDVLVQLCQHQLPGADGTYAPGWIRVSVNGGTSYGPVEAVPLLAQGEGTPGDQLAAAGAIRMLMVEHVDGDGEDGSQVLLTVNGGVSWSTVLRLPAGAPVVLVGFEDPLTARVAQGDVVWTTRNGGRTWVSGRC